MEDKSIKEIRIRKITQLYYSRKEVQKAIFNFCKNRETIPRYFEGFGKRPDNLEYPGDIFELVKKGATSFHCSEEIWKNPLEISTDFSEEKFNELRIGWDLLLDIDSKYIDYSKIMADLIIKVLGFHGVKNIGIKFSGSKGFHIIVPWKAFPKEINNVKTSVMFPLWPRIITQYLMHTIEKDLIKEVSNLQKSNKYIMDFEAPKEVMPDLILVSPRHLFRAPYSLHEKTSLSSMVLSKDKIKEFDLKDADPAKIKIKDFMPNSKEGEARELLVAALDWAKDNLKEKQVKAQGKYADFKPVKIDNVLEGNFPPCIKNIFKGLADGQARSLFALINIFRSVGMDKEELEKRIEEWNKKNRPPLKKGYIFSQLSWAYKRKPLMPPNCKEFYQGIGVCQPDHFCTLIKNPVNYVIKKSFSGKSLKKKNK